MRLELMTYALRKRDRDGASTEAEDVYDDSESVVAGMVAFRASENSCDAVTLPVDLSEVVLLWPELGDGVRDAVLTIIRQSASR